MTFSDLMAWVDGHRMMYLVSKGEMTPIAFDEYSKLSLGTLPEDSRIVADARLAYIISAYQQRKAAPVEGS